MNSKLVKAGLFSFFVLGALTSVTTSFTKSQVKHEQATTKYVTSNPSSKNEEWILQSDESLLEDKIIGDGQSLTIDLNGYVLHTQGHIFDVSGEGASLIVKDSCHPLEHPHRYNVNQSEYYWELDDEGENTVYGGLIYCDTHDSSIIRIFKRDENISADIEIDGGTLCGAGVSAVGIICSGTNTGDLTLEMNGGSISGNACLSTVYNGGGVDIQGKAIFTLNNGLISENFVNYKKPGGGGIYLSDGAKFIMNGGKITKNIYEVSVNTGLTYGGGGICCEGASMARPSITINDGEISYNKAISHFSDFSIEGGGIYSDFHPDFVMNGGLITHNIAENSELPTAAKGGGISTGGSGTINGGEISYNEAGESGGVHRISEIDVNDENGAELKIVNNKAYGSVGGINFNGSSGGKFEGKIIVKDNESLTDTHNNFYYNNHNGSINITGALTGSDIHFSPSDPEKSAFSNYESSGHTTDFANEFFHYDGPNTNYLAYDSANDLITTPEVPDSKVTHPIAPLFNNEISNLIVGADDAYDTQVVGAKCSFTEGHLLNKVRVYTDSGDEITFTDNQFTMPNEPVTVELKVKHNILTHFEQVDPTCVKYGCKEYYQCQKCGLYCEDADGSIEIGDEEALQAWKDGPGRIEYVDHDLELVKGKPATCEADGWKDYYQCKECGICYEDIERIFPIPDLEAWKVGLGKLPKTPHNHITKISGQAPKALEPGFRDYYECSDCHHCFEDSMGLKAIEDINAWKVNEGIIAPTLGMPSFVGLVVASGILFAGALLLLLYPLAKKNKADMYAIKHYELVFTNISYNKRFKTSELEEHIVKFKYNNRYLSYFFVTQKDQHVNETEIMKRFDELKKNGKLVKYVNTYRRKKVANVILCFAILALIAALIVYIVSYF